MTDRFVGKTSQTIFALMPDSPFDVTIQVGRIMQAEPFPAARKPHLCKLRIDLGARTVQSAAQLLARYTTDELIGKHVCCATNLGRVTIAGFRSEVLVVGVPDEEGHPVLVAPDEAVPLGGTMY